MSMTTQCPSCSTTFRVTPQQLQSQQGMVRCGRCATVFDGFKSLATLPEEVRAEPSGNMVAAAAPEIPEPAPAPAPVADENPLAAAEMATREVEADAVDDDAEVPIMQSAADEPATAENAADQESATGSSPVEVVVEARAFSAEGNDGSVAEATPEPEPVVIADALAPTGIGNPDPLFRLNAAALSSVRLVGDGRHARLTLDVGGVSAEGIAFGRPDAVDLAGATIDLVARVSRNTYRGRTRTELQVMDLRRSGEPG